MLVLCRHHHVDKRNETHALRMTLPSPYIQYTCSMPGSPPRPSDWLPASAPAPVAAPQPSMRMSPSPLPSGPVAPAPTELTSRSSTDTLLAAMGARKEAMHIPSVPPGYGGEVPQRVVPISPQPRLPRSEEERMFTQLLIALMTPPKANDSTPRPSPSPFPPPRPTPSPLPPVC